MPEPGLWGILVHNAKFTVDFCELVAHGQTSSSLSPGFSFSTKQLFGNVDVSKGIKPCCYMEAGP